MASDLVAPAPAEGSPEVQARVTAARARQRARLKELGAASLTTNAALNGDLLEKICAPDETGLALLRQAADSLHLSARGYHRTLRVARTLADLDGLETVNRMHVAEALSYRGETLRSSKAA